MTKSYILQEISMRCQSFSGATKVHKFIEPEYSIREIAHTELMEHKITDQIF